MNKIIIGLSILTATLLADSVIDISAISITATGIEESVVEQPLSIATKGEEEVKLDQVIFQKDLLNSLSGVQIEQTGSVIGHTTAIRMQKNTSAYYLFMQDGIPVQSSGFFNHNGLAYTTFQSATSVEVLKGAGTALYGSDAVAAVVNVQSLKKPSKVKEVSIKGMAGSNGYLSTTVESSDTIDKNSAYRASVGYMKSDGWRDHTNATRFEANVRYDQTLNDDNDLKVMFNTSSTEAQQADSFNDYENIKNGSQAASDDSAYFTALQNTQVKRKFDYARLSAEWNNYSFRDVEISLTPYVRYNRNRYVATWEKNLPSNDNELTTFGLMQKNTYDTSWGRLIGGFDAEYTQSSQKNIQDFDHTVSGWGGATYNKGSIYDYDVNYMAIAPYLHAEYDITKKVVMTAGLRYDYNHYDYTNNLSDGNASDISTPSVYYRPSDRTDSFSHLSPKLSLSYKPSKEMNVYARYANGFRIPQASRLYSVKVGYENINLTPELSDTYEVGIKKSFSNKGYVELATYYMTIDDTIIRDGATDGYRNGGSSVHKGIETTGELQATEDWAARVAYSYSMHNYVHDSKYDNNEISQAPNHTGNARLIYTPSNIKGLRVMGEYQYIGSYFMDDAHVKTYGGYNIGNLKADYTYSKSFVIFAKVTNITDERYSVSSSYAYGSDNYTPGDPRQAYIGAEIKW